MKTISEIQAEAQRLTVLGRQFQAELVQYRPGDLVVPRTLMELPASASVLRAALTPEVSSPVASGRVRYIEAAIEKDDLVYRLMERDAQSETPGFVGSGASLVMTSYAAYDVLRGGYELLEEERLAKELEPYAEWSEDHEEVPSRETVGEVEALLETNLLPLADRIRTKLDISDFLSGRLSPSAFISRTIERQCEREGRVEQCAYRHELKVTVDET